ncbi:MAG: hypothetical protein H7Z41_00660 [Cytophagales bacterium]|nr:hypothetical protein [Armatimonadota bacterium]
MGSAYTPGLTVSAHTTITKTRRLPLAGQVLVAVGDAVQPSTVVARAQLPGMMQTVKVAAQLGVEPADVPAALLAGIGDSVERGQLLAQTKGFLGLFKSDCKSSATGTIEIISPVSGNVGVRESPTPIEITAYIPGIVTEVMPGEGVVIEARGAFIQGIFGIGGERRAPLLPVSPRPDSLLTEADITPEMAGKVIIGGANISGAALKKAAEVGITGIVVGGIVDKDLVEYLGYDIGVAITGHENIPLTLVITEGFGTIAMADRTFTLLNGLAGREASLSGATQIRAGVIRPEIIVADAPGTAVAAVSVTTDGEAAFSLGVGTAIRIIREPYFGKLATVSALPQPLVRIGSGAEVRVLEATLNENGASVTVPRANVEIVAG